MHCLFLIPPTTPSRLQQLLYNKVILTSLQETIGTEVFDRSTFLSEIYTFSDMVPVHVFYFLILSILFYKHGGVFKDSQNSVRLLSNYPSDAKIVYRSVRSYLLVLFFLFTKNVENAI
jgi:hypothetical protein